MSKIDNEKKQVIVDELENLFDDTTQNVAGYFTKLVYEYGVDRDAAVALLAAKITYLAGEVLSYSSPEQKSTFYQEACMNIAESIQENTVGRGKILTRTGRA